MNLFYHVRPILSVEKDQTDPKKFKKLSTYETVISKYQPMGLLFPNINPVRKSVVVIQRN